MGGLEKVLLSLLGQIKDYPLDCREPLKKFKRNTGRVKSVIRKLTLIRRGSEWECTGSGEQDSIYCIPVEHSGPPEMGATAWGLGGRSVWEPSLTLILIGVA